MKFVAKLQLHFNKIAKAEGKARKRILKRCGAYVRKIARDFVKHRSNPDQAAPPLHSPYDHFGLKSSIIFDTDENFAYIGPRYIKRGLANVARLHEFGGEAVVKDIDQDLWNGVRIGQVAPVTETHLRKRGHKDTIVHNDMRTDPKSGRKVVWIRIANKRQAKHATRLYHRLMAGSTATKLVKYPPRPYMAPALMKALPTLSSVWKNAIR